MIGREFMDSYFYCSECKSDIDTEECEVNQIIETQTGRVYLFECPYCGSTETSEICYEREIADIR